jgi:antitoxin component of RelBE/YafQ-DinJ toxin-antitoxin module
MSKKDESLTVRITKEMRSALEAISGKIGVDVSTVVRWALTEEGRRRIDALLRASGNPD